MFAAVSFVKMEGNCAEAPKAQFTQDAESDLRAHSFTLACGVNTPIANNRFYSFTPVTLHQGPIQDFSQGGPAEL